MTVSNPNLDVLSKALTEFFLPSTNSERRVELQSYFDEFQNTPQACHLALQCLSSIQNDPTLTLFCLGILETTLIQKWPLLESYSKQQICSFILGSLENHTTMNNLDANNNNNINLNFVTKKLAKILALQACFDWPSEFPTYFDLIRSHILNPAGDQRKSIVGLYCLQSTYEQWANPPELVSHSRKLELVKLLNDHSLEASDMLSTLVTYHMGQLELLTLTKTVLMVNPTNQPDQLANLWDPLLLLVEHLISDCLTANGSKSYCLVSVLNCLDEVVRFAANKLNSIDIPVILFVLSLVGTPQCLAVSLKSEQSLLLANLKSGSYIKQLSMLALTCLQDLIEQKDLRSTGSIDYLLVLFRMIQCHLALITGHIIPKKMHSIPTTTTPATSTSASQYNTPENDIACIVAMDAEKQSNFGDYLLKLVDLLRCLMPHICHLSGYNLFDFGTFLQLVYELTFSIKDLDIYFNCLQLWSQFFDSIRVKYGASKADSNLPNLGPVLPTYLHTILFAFGQSLLAKLFYTENANFLDSLDEDVLDDFSTCSRIPEMSYINSTTTANPTSSNVFCPVFQSLHEPSRPTSATDDPCEYRLFLRESLLTFHNLADLIPDQLINLTLERFQSTWTDYTAFVNSTGLLSLGSFTVPKQQPLHRMHWVLRDYATCLQVIGFIADLLFVENCPLAAGRDILQVLMQNLQLNVIMLPIVPAIEERLIKYSLIEVVVQNILILHSFIVSGCLTCSITNPTTVQPSGKILLTSEERDSFITQLFVVLERFLLSVDGSLCSSPTCSASSGSSTPTLISPRIRLSAGLLFKSLITSPQRDICPSPHLVLQFQNGHKSDLVASNTFYHIFNAVSQSKVDEIQTDIHVLRLLLCALISYLSLDQEEDKTNKPTQIQQSPQTMKHQLLDQLVSQFFSPYLNLDYFIQNQVRHFIYLGLLNDAILGLENATSTTRQTFLNILIQTGVIDNLVNCLMHILGKSTLSSPIQMKCCTIYLTFFTSFVRILSYSERVMSQIAQLFGQIIRTLRSATNTTSASSDTPDLLPLQLVEHLLDMLLLISQNRRIFIPLLSDIIELCCFSFLPSLASLPGAYYKDDSSLISVLVCNACLNNPTVSQHLYEILFSSLSNGFSFFFASNPGPGLFVPIDKRYTSKQPQVFHRILSLILATLHPDQVSSPMVRFTIENLINLNRLRKLFGIPEFNQTWLPQFMSNLLDYLLDAKHASCKDTLLSGLHQLALAFGPNSKFSSGESNSIDLDQQFVRLFLPCYLERFDYLDQEQRSVLLSVFTDSGLTGLYKPKQLDSGTVNVPDLDDLETFSVRIEQFVSGVRFYRKMNTALGNGLAVVVSSAP